MWLKAAWSKVPGGAILAAGTILTLAAVWLVFLRYVRPQREGDGLTLLHRAAEAGDLQRVRALLSGGVAVDTPGRDGITPLDCAARAGQLEVAKLLVAHGADVNAGNCLPWNPAEVMRPLSWAVGPGHLEVVKFLVEAGAEIDYSGPDGMAPLASAAMCGQTDIVGYLLHHGANPNRKDSSGRTALYLADGETVRLLVEGGARVNIRDLKGWTPLHSQAHENNSQGCQYLIEYGADVNAKDERGRTPLDEALEKAYWEPGSTVVIDLLRKHGGLRGAPRS